MNATLPRQSRRHLPVLPVLALLAVLAGCSADPSAPLSPAKPQPTVAAKQAPVALSRLILAEAVRQHPQFDQLGPEAVTDVDEMIQAKAGFEPLPSIAQEPDPSLKELYQQVSTLYQLNEVIAAQALLRTRSDLSPAGLELRTLVDDAYTPVGDPESLEVEDGASADSAAQELQDYAQRLAKAYTSLRGARLVGQERELAVLRVTAGVYHDTNGVALAAADAALKVAGDDPRTRRAIDKALADAQR